MRPLLILLICMAVLLGIYRVAFRAPEPRRHPGGLLELHGAAGGTLAHPAPVAFGRRAGNRPAETAAAHPSARMAR